jgi:hypothetical protein
LTSWSDTASGISVTTTAEIELDRVTITATTGMSYLILATASFTKDGGNTSRAETLNLRRGTDNSGTLLQSANTGSGNLGGMVYGTGTVGYIDTPGSGSFTYRLSAVNFASSTVTANNIRIDVVELSGSMGPTGATGPGDVTLTGVQTLTNKTLTDPAITGTILEDVFTITDGAAFEVDPGNGSVQLITLGASRTPKATNFAAGESITLMVNDGTAYALTWTDATWGSGGVIWTGGSAPTLATTGFTVIQFWKVSTQVYGALVGSVA